MGGSGGGGGGYGGGGYGGNDGQRCIIALNTSLSSPNPSVISSLQTGNILTVVLNQSSGNPVVEVLSPAGIAAGSLAGVPNLRALIQCINEGHDYVFVVTTIAGSRVEGRLRNA